jgi:chemotaxis protein methyltransferase CheR
MDSTRIASELTRQLGLVPRWKSELELEQAIAAVAAQWTMAPEAIAAALAAGDRDLIRDLAARFTIDESYFLRHPEHFEALRLFLTARGWPCTAPPPRILCAGCAKGEEAYSIAAVLREHCGLAPLPEPPIQAIDVNPDSIASAGQGHYTPWSLRDVPRPFLERHFEPLPEGKWSVRPALRRLVRFERSGVQEYLARCADGSLDVVFFRNVSVYFDPRACEEVFIRLRTILVPSGMLVLAPTDPLPERDLLRSRADGPPSVLYPARRTSVAAPRGRGRRTSQRPRSSRLPSLVPKPASPALRQGKNEAPRFDPEEAFRRACQLGDRGHEPEALTAVEALLEKAPRHKGALWLRGKLRMARDEAKAACADFELALSVDAADVVVRYWLALSLLTQGKAADCLRQLGQIEETLSGLRDETILADTETSAAELLHAARALKQALS